MAEKDAKEIGSTMTNRTEVKDEERWKSSMIDLGMHMLTGFLSGLTLAAGNHCYQVLMRGNYIGSEDSNVVPLRRQG